MMTSTLRLASLLAVVFCPSSIQPIHLGIVCSFLYSFLRKFTTCNALDWSPPRRSGNIVTSCLEFTISRSPPRTTPPANELIETTLLLHLSPLFVNFPSPTRRHERHSRQTLPCLIAQRSQRTALAHQLSDDTILPYCIRCWGPISRRWLATSETIPVSRGTSSPPVPLVGAPR